MPPGAGRIWSGTLITRRDILRGLGVAGLTLPFAQRIYAQATGTAPLRLVCWPMMNGAAAGQFYPSNLTAMSRVTTPLAPYKDMLTFVDGLGILGSFDHYAVRSSYSGAAVNSYNTPDPRIMSLDQLVANKIAATAPTKLKSLHLGAIPADNISLYKAVGRSTLFFNLNGALDYEANPVTAFDRTFAGVTTPGPTQPTGPAPDAQLLADLENGALDITDAELKEVAAQVSNAMPEAAKIAMHGNAVKLLRPKPLTPGGTGGDNANPAACAGTIASVEKLRPTMLNNPGSAYNYAAFSDIFDAQIDIMARALNCGLTRVATLQAASADGPQTVPINGGLAHHPSSHGDPNTFAMMQAWYFGKLKRFMDAINVPDPLDPTGKTVLYNTVILVIAECRPDGHGSDNVPFMIAGRGGGLVKGGALLPLPGVKNTMALRSIATRVFGVAANEVGHFGATNLAEVLV
jgi:hypothetical protein